LKERPGNRECESSDLQRQERRQEIAGKRQEGANQASNRLVSRISRRARRAVCLTCSSCIPRDGGGKERKRTSNEPAFRRAIGFRGTFFNPDGRITQRGTSAIRRSFEIPRTKVFRGRLRTLILLSVGRAPGREIVQEERNDIAGPHFGNHVSWRKNWGGEERGDERTTSSKVDRLQIGKETFQGRNLILHQTRSQCSAVWNFNGGKGKTGHRS